MPPLQPLEESSMDDENTIVIPVDEIKSDGTESKWPDHPKWQKEDPVLYLSKLATQWVKHMGGYEEGVNYSLDRLPDGYVLLSRPRNQKPDVRDKFLYGHPSGQYFNSPNNFWPHFRFLATRRTSLCECALCKNYDPEAMARRKAKVKSGAATRVGGHAATAATERGARRGRKPARSHHIADEEGTQDVFKELVCKLQKQRTIDQEVIEMDSMEWRAEQDKLRQLFTSIGLQSAFIPRAGELVLWTQKLDGDEIAYNEANGTFQMYCRRMERFTGFPKWRAGVVAQIPEETVTLQDAYEKTDKTHNVNMSGFRVETFPDPNSDDKTLSSQYSYIPLCNIRPLNYWDIVLQGYPEKNFHPSIKYALTIMSSFSMLDKYHFKGEWPDAVIYSHGLYLGAELLIQGDAVCLMPQKPITPNIPPPEVTDVLVISSIRFELSSCDANPNSPLLAQTMTPYVYGKAYTSSVDNAYHGQGFKPTSLADEEVIEAFSTTGMKEYGHWYPMHSSDSELRMSLSNIIGRIYESDYMRVMFGDRFFGLEHESVVNGRQYGRRTDGRIPEDGEWYCGDHRIETLGVETFNGIEVGVADDTRDLKMWRANLKVIDGVATTADQRDARNPRVFRPQTTSITGGAIPSSFENMGKTSTMVSRALEPGVVSSRTSPATRANGMPDIEEDEEFASAVDIDEESSSSTDELAQVLQQPLFIRGGTEESLGGDYKPESKKARRQ